MHGSGASLKHFKYSYIFSRILSSRYADYRVLIEMLTLIILLIEFLSAFCSIFVSLISNNCVAGMVIFVVVFAVSIVFNCFSFLILIVVMFRCCFSFVCVLFWLIYIVSSHVLSCAAGFIYSRRLRLCFSRLITPPPPPPQHFV